MDGKTKPSVAQAGWRTMPASAADGKMSPLIRVGQKSGLRQIKPKKHPHRTVSVFRLALDHLRDLLLHLCLSS